MRWPWITENQLDEHADALPPDGPCISRRRVQEHEIAAEKISLDASRHSILLDEKLLDSFGELRVIAPFVG